jgi:hypothetical protein
LIMGSTDMNDITMGVPNYQALDHENSIVSADENTNMDTVTPAFVSSLGKEVEPEKAEEPEKRDTIVTEPHGEALESVVASNFTMNDPAATIADACSEDTDIHQSALEVRSEAGDPLTEATAESNSTVEAVREVPLATSTEVIEVPNVETESLDLVMSANDQGTEQASAAIVLVGGRISQNNEGEWLVSPAKGIFRRMPPLSTCLLYCAVAVDMMIMLVRRLAAVMKANRVLLEKMMGYLLSNPWLLLIILFTGTEQLFLLTTVILSFVLMGSRIERVGK